MSNEFVKANIELLCDIKVFLGLACIILMLECIQGLFKFAQTQDAFICDFVAIVKSCQGDLYRMHCNEKTRYGHNVFGQNLDIVDHRNDVLDHVWVTKPSLGIEYGTFQFYERTYMLYKCCIVIGCLS
jgi:hypothetical protein